MTSGKQQVQNGRGRSEKVEDIHRGLHPAVDGQSLQVTKHEYCKTFIGNQEGCTESNAALAFFLVVHFAQDEPCLIQEEQEGCCSKRTMASSASADPPQRKANRLATEKSPYLLQHAYNPVDWYPWGEEAFKKAREENKPIFLSVGYSTCHWCHVMERESFENSEIGHILSTKFVPIKVDREERPDVDKVYMTFVQATTGSGGWPMSVWLTPDLRPIVGGTYFPPDDRYYNQRGFKSILKVISEQWQEKQSEIENQGTKILDALTRGTHATDNRGTQGLPDGSRVSQCFQTLRDSFDKDLGGFGIAPKFPQPVNFSFLLRYFQQDPSSEDNVSALHMCLHTLTKMANGGIHDHISQGFHRYSTDQAWHVPHFEKMLYDQAQLAVSYVEAYQVTKDQFYADIAKDIFTYVSRDLSHPEGGFYSAEDADSLPTKTSKDKKEGAFCVWEFAELQQLLAQKISPKSEISQADIFCYFYGAKDAGNVDPMQDPHEELKNKNVLIIRSTVEETKERFQLSAEEVRSCLAKCRQTLYEVRQERPRPHLDDKMVTAWNGLMISGFARGGQVLEDMSLTQRAVKAAEFLQRYMFDQSSGSLLRSAYTSKSEEVVQISSPIHGFVDDYAFMIRGLLDLYESCHEDRWLAWAEQLQIKQIELFWDEEDGAFFSSPAGDNSIVLRMKEDLDGAEPSPNSVSCMNLLRLSTMLDKPDWSAMAERIIRVFANRIEKVPQAVPELVSAFMFFLASPKQIVIVGDKNSEDTKELIRVVNKLFLPNKVLIVCDEDPNGFIQGKAKSIASLKRLDGKATAFVCENFSCSLPVNSTEALESQLSSSSSRLSSSP
ncbi:spermatogenesis-associated protein 20 [Plakobranchus ocellatus]|uniref:Spermatogenesis-associated protein 20 n=1 Tax=Plakobranchus ocellatus TaxID=259542 RepID=A0AAV4DC34_9GAST|nr:spermatogenesis-associated protein 20 [Plakobranchus ocellatus]